MHDALNRRAASRARFAEASVDRHPFVECRHLLGKRVFGLTLQPVCPFSERRDRRRTQPRRSLGAQLAGQLERRQSGAMKNFIRVCVADAAEQMRIGKRALQRVALLLQRRRERTLRRSPSPRARQGRMTRARPPRGPRGAMPASVSQPRSTAACHRAKSNAASPTFLGMAAPRSRHLNRPAIIRWNTRNRFPSNSQTMRFPMRRNPVTVLPSTSASGGSTDRSRNGTASLTRSRECPVMRSLSAER